MPGFHIEGAIQLQAFLCFRDIGCKNFFVTVIKHGKYINEEHFKAIFLRIPLKLKSIFIRPTLFMHEAVFSLHWPTHQSHLYLVVVLVLVVVALILYPLVVVLNMPF